MQSLDYCYIIAAICVAYLFSLFLKRKYRLFLPSTMHTLTWLITVILLCFQLTGTWVSNQITNSSVNLSTEYILYLVISSIIGFTLAHIVVYGTNTRRHVVLIESEVIDNVLIKFRWVPYICFFVGLLLLYYLFSSGSFQSFASYRDHAVTITYTGVWSIIKQLSGHINIWGNLFLVLLGYKHGLQGIRYKEIILYILLCSTINISIGGRLWIITSTLPYLVSYFYVSKFLSPIEKNKRKDKRKIFVLLTIFAMLFSLMGVMRDDSDDKDSYIDRFLYYTDGTRMSNVVFNQFPVDTYNWEYGACEFLSQFVESPMSKKFKESISGDIGMSVTVKSAIPSLYYDFASIFSYSVKGFFISLIVSFKT